MDLYSVSQPKITYNYQIPKFKKIAQYVQKIKKESNAKILLAFSLHATIAFKRLRNLIPVFLCRAAIKKSGSQN